jgi:hypothetical protein
VVRKLSLALILTAIAGAASATNVQSGPGAPPSNSCYQFLWFTVCTPSQGTSTLQAPEIDPASAMAGLTMLVGGLAVVRGRRSKKSKE